MPDAAKSTSIRRFAPGIDVRYQELDSEIVLLNMALEEYESLNSTGAEIWKLLAAGEDTDMIAGKIASRYRIDRDTALRDVDELIQVLLEKKLIVPETTGRAVAD